MPQQFHKEILENTKRVTTNEQRHNFSPPALSFRENRGASHASSIVERTVGPAPQLWEDTHANLTHRLWTGWLDIRVTERTHSLNIPSFNQSHVHPSSVTTWCYAGNGFILRLFSEPLFLLIQNFKTSDFLEELRNTPIETLNSFPLFEHCFVKFRRFRENSCTQSELHNTHASLGYISVWPSVLVTPDKAVFLLCVSVLTAN